MVLCSATQYYDVITNPRWRMVAFIIESLYSHLGEKNQLISTKFHVWQVEASRSSNENGERYDHNTIRSRNYTTTHSQTPIFCIVSRADKRYI